MDAGEPTASTDGAVKIFDLHCDTIDRLAGVVEWPFKPEQDPGRMTDLADNDADISLDKMGDTGWCQCFGIFMPEEYRGRAAEEFFGRNLEYFKQQLNVHASRIGQARVTADIPLILEAGKKAAILTVEGGSVLAGKFERVLLLKACGVRVLSLTWNGENEIASGNMTDHGFSKFGKLAVGELEHRDIVCDVSHLNDTGFWELEGFAKRPYIATHSNARAVCDHPRNLTDDQFKAIVSRGGIAGINFANSFLANPADMPEPSFDQLSRHVEHFLELGGEDAIALGSDYDGTDMPAWLNPCSKMPGLHKLLAGRFGGGIADKICFDNAMAFFQRYDAAL